MKKTIWTLIICLVHLTAVSQESYLDELLSVPALKHASVAVCIRDAESGLPVIEFNTRVSLKPASIMKLVSSAAAIELLGPEHRFSTITGYTGTLNKSSGRLNGDIVIRGGGDPALGSPRFPEHYGDPVVRWSSVIRAAGIKQVRGRVIADDTYFDYQPVPARWLWEDIGNYYGAGAFGLALFDNTYEIHLNTSSVNSSPVIEKIVPEECRAELVNRLVASGTTDQGYVFAAPYSGIGWIEGSVPAGRENFVLKASIPDPPMLIAEMTDKRLKEAGIKIKGNPSTARIEPGPEYSEITPLDTIISPPLADLIEMLNKESVNLYAEHFVKELGKVFLNEGTTESGTEIVMQFLNDSGIEAEGFFIEDGSGLSPVNAVTAAGMVDLLLYMRNKSKHYTWFYSSLPGAGKEGTLKSHFGDPLFDSRLRAKSGSMARVRSYAGYLTTISGKELAFCIIINNFTGSSQETVRSIEELLKQVILN